MRRVWTKKFDRKTIQVLYTSERHVVHGVWTKNPIEKPFKFCIRRSVALYTECERYTGYSMNKAFVHLHTRGSIMANDVRREANEDKLNQLELVRSNKNEQ